jgi:hypothetical protein
MALQEPGLRVTLRVDPIEDPNDDAMAVRVDVVEAARPLRISVYVDGDLVDTWSRSSGAHELQIPTARGRHVVTARAVDAHGRWGGASTLFELA